MSSPESVCPRLGSAEQAADEIAVRDARLRDAQSDIEALMTLLTFHRLAVANRRRCERWHPGFPKDAWTGADWSNAMQGEAGEAGNVVKKLRRAELDTKGALDPDVPVLLEKLGDEIADTVIYADLLAQYYGLNLAACIARKFNAVSVREGFPERLPGGRPWTPARPSENGRGKTITVKRACNGCGELIGDVTDAEMERAIAGLPAEDVRAECSSCCWEVSTGE